MHVSEIGQLLQQDAGTLGNRQQITAEGENDRDPGKALDTPAIESFAEKGGDRGRPASAEISAEKNRAKNVAHRRVLGKDYVRAGLSGIRKTGFAEEHRRTHHARHQRAQDQQGGRTPAGNVIIVQSLDATPGVVADDDVDQDADCYCRGVDIQTITSLSERARCSGV